MRYLKNSGVNIQPLSKEISRDEEKCTHCGVCDLICPSGALSIVGERRELVFEADKCIACELCLEACPPGAMHLNF
ncbi:MAG: 4Fe-4S binding protein [Elusimicrobia bacterium]|nr:4Fe-4S binding protein [Elusimicrobiota bacterium]